MMRQSIGKAIGKWCAIAIFLLIVVILTFVVVKITLNSNYENDVNETETTYNEVGKESVTWSQETLLSYIKLCDYENLQITIDVPELIEEYDLSLYVNEVLKNFPEYELLENTIVDDDHCVFLDISGKLEGDTELCLDESDVVYIPGNNQLLKEIEDEIVGKKVGDIFEVDYVYPDNFADTEYSGKKITFTIKIKGIYEQNIITYDVLDDEFAKNVLGCRSKDEFLSQIKTEMYSILTEYEESAIENAVVNKVIKDSSFDVPEEYYESKFEQERQLFINYYCSGDESQYETQIYNYTGYSASEYKEEIYEDFKKLVNYELAAMVIAENEGISIDSSDYNEFVETQKESYGNTTLENLYSLLSSDLESGQEYLKKQYYMYAVTNYLSENVKIDRTEGATVSNLVFDIE